MNWEYLELETSSFTAALNCESFNHAIRGASLEGTVGKEAYLLRMYSRRKKWSMNLGVPLKYAGEAGTIRAGIDFLLLKLMGEAALDPLRSVTGSTSKEARDGDTENGRRWDICEVEK